MPSTVQDLAVETTRHGFQGFHVGRTAYYENWTTGTYTPVRVVAIDPTHYQLTVTLAYVDDAAQMTAPIDDFVSRKGSVQTGFTLLADGYGAR